MMSDMDISFSSGHGGDGEDLVTNSSFLLNRPDAINFLLSSPDSSSDGSTCRQQDTSSRGSAAAPAPAFTRSEAMSVAVATFVQRLFPSLVVKTLPPWLASFCPHIARRIERASPQETEYVLKRLRRHMRINEDGALSMSLVAMSILRLHPEVVESVARRLTDAKAIRLPLLLRERLSCGKFVPMEHVLYGECMMEGTVCHVDAQGKDVPPEPYPLNVKKQLPPPDFVEATTRSDVLRGLTTHGTCLARRFPLLAASMHGLVHHLWELMFTEKMSAATGIQLYNAYFEEFEKQLSLLTVLSMDRFPEWLLERVAPLEPKSASDQAAETP